MEDLLHKIIMGCFAGIVMVTFVLMAVVTCTIIAKPELLQNSPKLEECFYFNKQVVDEQLHKHGAK